MIEIKIYFCDIFNNSEDKYRVTYVSQIWPLIRAPSYIIAFAANSTPMVGFGCKLKLFFVNLVMRLLFPTPESPITTTNIISDHVINVLIVQDSMIWSIINYRNDVS